MTDQADTSERKPKTGGKTLSLKRTVESGHVRQNFSHGRTKTVVVEKKKSRTPPKSRQSRKRPRPPRRRRKSRRRPLLPKPKRRSRQRRPRLPPPRPQQRKSRQAAPARVSSCAR